MSLTVTSVGPMRLVSYEVFSEEDHRQVLFGVIIFVVSIGLYNLDEFNRLPKILCTVPRRTFVHYYFRSVSQKRHTQMQIMVIRISVTVPMGAVD